MACTDPADIITQSVSLWMNGWIPHKKNKEKQHNKLPPRENAARQLQTESDHYFRLFFPLNPHTHLSPTHFNNSPNTTHPPHPPFPTLSLFPWHFCLNKSLGLEFLCDVDGTEWLLSTGLSLCREAFHWWLFVSPVILFCHFYSYKTFYVLLKKKYQICLGSWNDSENLTNMTTEPDIQPCVLSSLLYFYLTSSSSSISSANLNLNLPPLTSPPNFSKFNLHLNETILPANV